MPAALIALTIDEVGMAKTAERKVEIAKRIKEIACDEHGLDPESLIFDLLTFTLTTGDEEWKPSAVETIEGIRRLKAELPDMAREDIDVTVENFVLTIKGEKKSASDVNEEQFHHTERRYGAFSRSFSLPQTVDAGRVAAEYKNGVLTVRLPLREEAKPRQIKIGGNGTPKVVEQKAA